MIVKKNILIVIVSLFCLSGFAQEVKPDKQNKQVVTDTEPSFPKGDKELYQFVLYNLNYSEESKRKYIEGEVTLSFDVKADSTVSNMVLISGVGYGIDDEVKKLIGNLKFIPGVQNGFPIKMNTMYSFPIKAH
ncbi:MAG: energy transducer TonB [Bacteroidetes bacterium]|nr:energy transducer TonB [Bacteroidota bacterium]